MTDSIHNSWTIARSAILTHQQRLAVTANNIANVNTPGYHRQQVHLATAPETPSSIHEVRAYSKGTGVRVADVVRVHNEMTHMLLRQQTADAHGHRLRADSLARLESILREEGDASLGAKLDAFWNAWYDVSNQPENVGFRSVAIQAGVSLASHLQSLDARLDSFEGQIVTGTPGNYTGQLPGDIDRFNQLTTELQDLNARISYSLSHFAPQALMDRRDVLLEELSALASVTVDSSHAVWLDGHAVVSADGSARAQLTMPDAGPPPVFELDGIPVTTASGRLGAWTDIWAVTDAMRARLNQVAAELADAVNGIHNSDLNAQGDSYDLTGERCDWDFFVGTTAASIAVNPIIYDPSNPMGMDPARLAAAATRHDEGPPPIPNPGDGARALQIAELATSARPGLNGQTLAAYHATGQALLGGMIQTERALAADGQSIIDALKDALQAETGVNLDEELMDMLSAQRAFQAASRLLQTIDELMVTILQMK